MRDVIGASSHMVHILIHLELSVLLVDPDLRLGEGGFSAGCCRLGILIPSHTSIQLILVVENLIYF